MLLTKPVLPNFLKAHLIASLTLGASAAIAGHHEKDDAIGDLKDMKAKHSLKTDKISSEFNTGDSIESTLPNQHESTIDKAEDMMEKITEVKPLE